MKVIAVRGETLFLQPYFSWQIVSSGFIRNTDTHATMIRNDDTLLWHVTMTRYDDTQRWYDTWIRTLPGCTISAACNQIPDELLRKGNRMSRRIVETSRSVDRLQSADESGELRHDQPFRSRSFPFERFFCLCVAQRDTVRLTGCQTDRRQAPAVVVFGSKSTGR